MGTTPASAKATAKAQTIQSMPVVGVSQPLRTGIHACRADVSIVHPVQALQNGMLKQRVDAKLAETAALWGSHMAMRQQMESAILSRHQRLPGLRSHFAGLNTLHNMDEDFGFEDWLDFPENRASTSTKLHDAMETKLKRATGVTPCFNE